jgi:hypothetical protein
MTDTPDLPPPASAGLPPVPEASPALPPGTPAGRPRIWQAALLFAAFGLLAGGSCAAFLSGMSTHGTSSDAWSLLFVLATPFAAGAFALLLFRLWRRRVAEAWPSLGQAALMGLAGAGLAVGGCGGWAMTMEASALLPIAFTLGALFVAGLALAVGACELFAIALFRLIFGRPVAR